MKSIGSSYIVAQGIITGFGLHTKQIWLIQHFNDKTMEISCLSCKSPKKFEEKTSPGISLIQGGMTSHGWQMVYGSQSSPMLSHWCRSPQSGAFSIASRRDHRGNARSTVRGRGGCWEWSLVMVKTTKASQLLVTWQVCIPPETAGFLRHTVSFLENFMG